MTSEPPSGKEEPNESFLSDIRRIRENPVNKSLLPQTSNQEIGWFTRIQKFDPARTDTR